MNITSYIFNGIKAIGFPVVLLIASTLCIQLHAYKYWESTMGHGLLYSLTIEGVAIAFWIYSRLKPQFSIIAIAIIATLLSFTAPALNNLTTIIDDYKVTTQRIDVWDIQKDRLISDTDILRENWETNLENSKTRGGWLTATALARDLYQEKSDNLDNHLISKPSILDILMNNIKLLTILISIGVLQFASVFLSRFIGDGVRALAVSGWSLPDIEPDKLQGISHQEKERRDGIRLAYSANDDVVSSMIPEGFDITAYVSTELIKLQAKDEDLTNVRLASIAGCVPRDISLLVNHEEKLRQKQENAKVRIVSEAKAIDIAEKCGIDITMYKQIKA
jgi:hypothetical protein